LTGLIERGVPTDPQVLGELAVDILLPFGKAGLLELRNGVRGVLQGTATISLPQDLTSGLLAALSAVTSAAASADAVRVQQALRTLEQVRIHTINSLQTDILSVVGHIGRLRIGETLEGLTRVTRSLRTVDDGVLEFLDTWRTQIAVARQQVESFDIAQVREFLTSIPDFIESQARIAIVEPIDRQVERLKEWVRNLLRHLPLRELRAEVSRFIHNVAQAVQDANLDGPAEVVRNALQTVREHLDPAVLTAEIQQALQQVEQRITQALDGVIAALDAIGTQVDNVAGQAEAVLQRVATALGGFKSAVANITAAVDRLGVDQAAQQVITALTTLRETAEKLLQQQPLPEPLRPAVEQLIDTLKDVDFEPVFQPVRQAAAELTIPAEVGSTVAEGLQAAEQALANLIPAELIASIEKEVADALKVIRDFNPATLIPDVSGFLDQASQFVDDLDPRAAVAQLREPFQAVLTLVDRAHPRLLLAPVIREYDTLFNKIQIPAPETGARRAVDLINTAGQGLGRAMLEPVQQLDPEGGATIAQPGTAPRTAQAPEVDGVRPGDVIRLFGFVPAKLREVLAGLAAGPAGQALAVVDSLTSGLARDLRRVQAELFAVQERLDHGLEQLLTPLADAQLQAQFAIQANFSAGGFDVRGALTAVALTGPGPLRAALAESAAQARAGVQSVIARASGQVGAELDRTIRTLESLQLSGLTGDLNALLAALDPEPIAAEIDALVATVVERAPTLLRELENDLRTAIQRLRAIVNSLNPGAQAQKFLAVLGIVREELDVLNPRRLADELAEVHAAIRAIITAYDPAVFATELHNTLTAIRDDIRALNPQTLLGALNFLAPIVNRVENANPAQALQGVGASLETVGQQLAELNPTELIAAVNKLGPNVVAAFEVAITAIRNEIVALLESLQFATSSASGSVSVGG
jgi:hypothetical protein